MERVLLPGVYHMNIFQNSFQQRSHRGQTPLFMFEVAMNFLLRPKEVIEILHFVDLNKKNTSIDCSNNNRRSTPVDSLRVRQRIASWSWLGVDPIRYRSLCHRDTSSPSRQIRLPGTAIGRLSEHGHP